MFSTFTVSPSFKTTTVPPEPERSEPRFTISTKSVQRAEVEFRAPLVRDDTTARELHRYRVSIKPAWAPEAMMLAKMLFSSAKVEYKFRF